MEIEMTMRKDMDQDDMEKGIKLVRDIFKASEKAIDLTLVSGVLAAKDIVSATSNVRELASSEVCENDHLDGLCENDILLAFGSGLYADNIPTNQMMENLRSAMQQLQDISDAIEYKNKQIPSIANGSFYHWFCAEATEPEAFEFARAAESWVKGLRDTMIRSMLLAEKKLKSAEMLLAEKKLERIVDSEIQCQHCDNNDLHAHMKEIVTCDKCNTDFASEPALKLHKTMNHKYDEVNGKADEAVEEKLEQELAENESLAPLHVTCVKCNTDFASESDLKLHNTMYHKYDEVNRKADKAVEEKPEQKLPKYESLAPLHVKCDNCNTDFASESALKHHKKMCHKCDKVNKKTEEAIEEKLKQKLAENESLAPPTEALEFSRPKKEVEQEIGKLNDKLKEEMKRNLALENRISQLLEQQRNDTETKNELRERVNHLEQKLAQTRGRSYKEEVVGNESHNHKDCSDEEEDRNNK